MKIYSTLLCFTLLVIISCDLERIEPGGNTGNATKFETKVGTSMKNDYPSDIITTSDGGYIIVGYTQIFTTVQNIQAYIVKVDSKGIQQWDGEYGGAKDDYAKAVVATSDGGYVFAGTSKSFSSNYEDIFLVKVNAQGTKVWEKNYGSADSIEYAFGIVPVDNGDFLIAYEAILGDPLVTNKSESVKLMRINSNGIRLSVTDGIQGRSSTFSMTKMIKTIDNQIVVAGYEYTDTDSRAIVAKLMPNGGLVWDKKFPETQGKNTNYVPLYGVVEMADKSLIAAGSFLGNNDHDFMLLRYSGIGAKTDDEIWGGANADELLGIARTLDGEVIVTGYTGSYSTDQEIYLSKRKATDGSIIWEKHFSESSVYGNDVEATPDGGYVLCTSQGGTSTDIVIIKTDGLGNFK